MKNLLLLLGIVLAGSACTNTDYHSYQFALLGDNPYSPPGYIRYLRMIEHVNAQPDLQWIVHLGDVKGGDSSCSDAELSRYFELNQLFEAPFIVTPGDNDWLDCKRASAGGFNDYERLAAFRRIFYPRAGYSTGGNPMPIMQQSAGDEFSEFVENAMWERDGVIFASVHVVALTEPATDPAQYARRTAAATAWIETAFNRAQQSNAKAVFLAMQADPWIVFGIPALVNPVCPTCLSPRNSLEWLYPLLVELSLAFGKPVVLAVGDTHIFRVDKPLYAASGSLVENFTRVEGFGSPLVHWINVKVEPDSPWVFSFRQQLVR